MLGRVEPSKPRVGPDGLAGDGAGQLVLDRLGTRGAALPSTSVPASRRTGGSLLEQDVLGRGGQGELDVVEGD